MLGAGWSLAGEWCWRVVGQGRLDREGGPKLVEARERGGPLETLAKRRFVFVWAGRCRAFCGCLPRVLLSTRHRYPGETTNNNLQQRDVSLLSTRRRARVRRHGHNGHVPDRPRALCAALRGLDDGLRARARRSAGRSSKRGGTLDLANAIVIVHTTTAPPNTTPTTYQLPHKATHTTFPSP